jgi:hypothetical protein
MLRQSCATLPFKHAQESTLFKEKACRLNQEGQAYEIRAEFKLSP